ncbi:1-acyl-sn-glycerol-3-phosphate acyltransferase [Marivirga arenosa]|uniref:1-acyl-sn-glycerol-3-phosphate acyltransferase n=1 Tax=Marivirga arenosa TaxID=3059076 RepID=A0AA49JCB1_9BACT|nr:MULTISPECIES: 1-acyl-sn-glycerol-3-phosphate acyltransferase [unclassified Marivirga]WKK79509.2 1-acyl-sn-glycerol-3-phosphate acyltransferase [Marivirga sp. BKB1-2]WMN06214.1 1-acyl-sn-glycerol-3-phosphate acyltransferase [Marivirga sp. ABR2-2]
MEYLEVFDSIRPYKDSEVNEAVKRFIQHPFFDQVTNRLFPEKSIDELKKSLSEVSSVKDFQKVMMYPTARRVLDSSSEGITNDGFDRINPENAYLFISNHRDIVLDSTILNVLLFELGIDTTEVAIGNNLLVNQWVTDLAKLNKNFIVNRNVAPREMYSYSQTLSSYIRYTILEAKTSIWIAQREGRTKDGDDQTQQGLLKMIGLSGGKDFYENYAPLRIAPMAISYEYDPCDVLKAREIASKLAGQPIEKTPEDDLQSMIAGITGVKGRVHISIGKIVDEKLQEIREIKNKNDQMQALADLIDERIHKNYKLWPNNFIAYDWLFENRFSDYYSKEEAEKFEDYLRNQAKMFSADFDELKGPLLAMYANPVKNKLKVEGLAESEL